MFAAVLVATLAVVGPARAAFTRFENLTEEQGLGNDSVSALAQDADGAMLFGTDAGLFRFDGVGVAPFDAGRGLPPGSWIRSLAVDEGGRVWVLTTNALFVGERGRFRPVATGRALDNASPHLLALAPGMVAIDVDGTLLRATVHPDLAGRDAVVGRFEPLIAPAVLARVPALADARFLTADGRGGFLVGCGMALCAVGPAGVAPVAWTEADGLPADRWQVARRAADGTIWVRSLDRLAFRPPGHARFATVAVPGGRDRLFVDWPARLDLLPDGHGGVLTQGAGGLLRWSDRGWQLDAHHPGGLSATPIETLLFDRERSLWVGTLGRGAFRSLGFDSWVHWTADDGLPSDIVWGMGRVGGDPRLWVATYGATVPLDTGAGTAALPAADAVGGNRAGGPVGRGVPGGSEVLAATAHGRLWLAPPHSGLTRLDPATGALVHVPLEGIVANLMVDDADRLWVSTDRGLDLIADADADPRAGAGAHGPALRLATVLAGAVAQAITDRTGAIWAVGASGVVRRGSDRHFTTVIPAGRLGTSVDALAFAPHGELWLATETAGVLRFRLDGSGAVLLPPITVPTLGSDNILFLHQDRRGAMWVGTDHGIDLLADGASRRFDRSDGLLTDDMNSNAVFEDRDGSMWFGTTRGLMHLRDPAHLPPLAPLRPHIDTVSFNGQPVDPARATPLRWSAGALVIRFGDDDFSRGSTLRFRYRLRPIDNEFTETAGREVRYAHVPAGHYRFELVSVDGVHRTVSAPAVFGLAIAAPWWRRPPFYAGCALALFVAVAAASGARRRASRRQRERLERIITARTDEIERARGELLRLTAVDGATGLANRQAILASVEDAIGDHGAAAGVALLVCDIDRFRAVNEAWGRDAGDAVLCAAADRLRDAACPPELPGRLEGACFAVVLPMSRPDDASGSRDPADRAAALRRVLTERAAGGEAGHDPLLVSAGLAVCRPGDDARALLGRAHAALTLAKSGGGDRLVDERAPPDESTALAPDRRPAAFDRATRRTDHDAEQRRRTLLHDLRVALAEEEFTLHYQPVVDVNRDVVTSCEALLRWQSPTRGRVPPVEFIPFAEENGLMPAIGDWVLRTACRDATAWPASTHVSVNLSPAQFRLPDLASRIEAILRATGLPPNRLELEITETAMVDDTEAATALLAGLRRQGIAIALDDFGTGYSSLSFLRTLPFDRLKIDRSFVQDLGTKSQAIVIIRAITGLCASLGASVTAEGVETDAQMEVLRSIGCAEIQGYRIARPCPLDELQPWLRKAARGTVPA